jgi:predicted dehydrogenase
MAKTRREVISGTVAALAASAVPGLAAPRRWRVGVVGCGWFGVLNAHALMQVAPAEIVAMCDVDQRMLQQAGKEIVSFPDSKVPPGNVPTLYKDYRTMLSKHAFDIVIIATPDHWHALPALAAMDAGADLYLEKPVGIDLAEGRAIAAAARRLGRIVQVGTQRRNSPCHVEARDRIIKEGKLGKAGLVEVYSYSAQRAPDFPAPSPPPEWIDWDFYCGPAPLVPYNVAIHPRRWRSFRAFGNGTVGDWAVHLIDTTRWMLGLGAPTTVAATGGRYFDPQRVATVPDTQTAQFTFGDIPMLWTRREWGAVPPDKAGWAATIYGDKGTLKFASSKYEFTPLGGGPVLTGNNDAEVAEFPRDPEPDKQLLAITRAHMRDFFRAIETRSKPAADIDEGCISTSCAILANLSMDLQRPLRWDGSHIVGDENAQQKGARPYRAPWKHPAVAA